MSDDDKFKITLQTAQAISGLLEELKENFPNTLPTKEVSEGELRFLQGQQKIISYIEYLLDVDEEE